MNEMEQQLVSARGQFLAELSELEEQSSKLRAAIAERRSKIAAIDTLIGVSPDCALTVSQSPDGIAEEPDAVETFTPVKAYWGPILSVLVEFGGRGRRERVIEGVGKKMSTILTDADYKKLPNSNNVVRWRNRVAWQASNMRTQGLIKNDSPRGIWEITDAGKHWLDDND